MADNEEGVKQTIINKVDAIIRIKKIGNKPKASYFHKKTLNKALDIVNSKYKKTIRIFKYVIRKG